MLNFLQQKLPVAPAVEKTVSYLTEMGEGFFTSLQIAGQFLMDNLL